jgi:hypothetical protein
MPLFFRNTAKTDQKNKSKEHKKDGKAQENAKHCSLKSRKSSRRIFLPTIYFLPL